MKQPSPALIARIVERFRALGDETRIRLLLALQAGERRVCDLADGVDVGQASVSKHLGILKNSGLVTVRREGNQAFYRVRDGGIFELCDLMCAGVQRLIDDEAAALAEPSD